MQDQKCIVFMTRKRHWTSDLRTPFKCNAKKGGGTVMLLLPITLDSRRWLVLHFTIASPQIIYCIAVQTSARLDAILDFGLSIPINASSLLSLICAPTTSSICETQPFQPVTRNTLLTTKLGFLTGILIWFVSRRNKQLVCVSFICVGVNTQYWK